MELFICLYCTRECKNKKSVINHERLCKLNPNRQFINTKDRKPQDQTRIDCDICNKSILKYTLNHHKKSCGKKLNSCLQCNKETKSKFCSQSCSCTYSNNRRAPRSEESKKKTSDALKNKPSPMKGIISKIICRIKFDNCLVCDKLFCTHHDRKERNKTCSDECKIIYIFSNRSYPNGARKTIKRFNVHQDKEVILESSWEVKVADELDKLNIIWIRPKYIKWVDTNGKNRLYFPDFYLPNYNLYLDPKNQYGMQIGKEKMNAVSKLINIKYGELEYILNEINKLISV